MRGRGGPGKAIADPVENRIDKAHDKRDLATVILPSLPARERILRPQGIVNDRGARDQSR
jgi:hypothetical protein